MNQGDLIVFLLMAISAVVGGASVWIAVALGRVRPADNQRLIPPSPVLIAQLNRLEGALKSVAVEVERIGESQRFMAKLLAAGPQRLPAPHPQTPSESGQ